MLCYVMSCCIILTILYRIMFHYVILLRHILYLHLYAECMSQIFPHPWNLESSGIDFWLFRLLTDCKSSLAQELTAAAALGVALLGEVSIQELQTVLVAAREACIERGTFCGTSGHTSLMQCQFPSVCSTCSVSTSECKTGHDKRKECRKWET